MAPIEVTFATSEGGATLLSVDADSPISTVSAEVARSLSIPEGSQRMSLNGNPLTASATFEQAGVKNGDLILVESISPGTDEISGTGGRTGATGFSDATAQTLLQQLRSQPGLLAQMRQSFPALATAVEAGDAARAAELFAMARSQAMGQSGTGGGGLGASGIGGGADSEPQHLDPMSQEYQERLAERIRMDNVMRNFEEAMEHNPESFGSVVMLFVDCKINGHKTVAFVDSGAQATIISKAHAERCNIFRLLDTRFAGVARGVGTARILGRIHLALLDVAGQVFEVSFTVLEDASYDMLLGLDMLRKHQATIDLRSNCLRIGTVEAPFLPEHLIPRNMRGPGGENTSSAPAAQTEASAPSAAAQSSGAVAPSSGAAVTGGTARVQTAAADAAKVQALVDLGFSADEARQALQACDGNQEQAAAILTRNKYGF